MEKMTPVQAYIKTLQNYKELNGSIDDAIIIAETLLIVLEKKMIDDYEREIDLLKEQIRGILNNNY